MDIQKARLLLNLKECFPHKSNEQIILFVRDIHKLSFSNARYSTLACNVGLKCTQKEAWKRVQENILRLCKDFGLQVNADGDPRGYTVKIKLPNHASNEMGGRWGIK